MLWVYSWLHVTDHSQWFSGNNTVWSQRLNLGQPQARQVPSSLCLLSNLGILYSKSKLCKAAHDLLSSHGFLYHQVPTYPLPIGIPDPGFPRTRGWPLWVMHVSVRSYHIDPPNWHLPCGTERRKFRGAMDDTSSSTELQGTPRTFPRDPRIGQGYLNSTRCDQILGNSSKVSIIEIEFRDHFQNKVDFLSDRWKRPFPH